MDEIVGQSFRLRKLKDPFHEQGEILDQFRSGHGNFRTCTDVDDAVAIT